MGQGASHFISLLKSARTCDLSSLPLVLMALVAKSVEPVANGLGPRVPTIQFKIGATKLKMGAKFRRTLSYVQDLATWRRLRVCCTECHNPAAYTNSLRKKSMEVRAICERLQRFDRSLRRAFTS